MQVTTMRNVLVFATALAIAPAGVLAQSRGTAGAAVHSAPAPSAAAPVGVRSGVSMHPSRSAVSHAAGSHGTTRNTTARHAGHATATRTGSRPSRETTRGMERNRQLEFDALGSEPNTSREFDSVPGLGFDYVHLAATHPNAVNGERRENNGAVLFPFFEGGYFIPGGPAPAAEADTESQQADDADEENVETPARNERSARSERTHRATGEAIRETVQEAPAPQVDVPEYVFVRRDGTVFFAVAYTWDKGALRYISSEGVRHSVAKETLDLRATQQFNEQRGMTFRLPA